MSNAVHGVSSRHQSLSCCSPASWHWNKKRWWGSRKPSDRQACWQARNHTWHLTALVKSLVNMHKQSMEKQLSRSRPVGWQCLSCLPWQCSQQNWAIRSNCFPVRVSPIVFSLYSLPSSGFLLCQCKSQARSIPISEISIAPFRNLSRTLPGGLELVNAHGQLRTHHANVTSLVTEQETLSCKCSQKFSPKWKSKHETPTRVKFTKNLQKA